MIRRRQLLSVNIDKNTTDVIKILSCLMIAFHHYSQDMVKAGTHNPVYQLFSTQGGWLGVAIFFFLSGYGLMKSDLKKHLDITSFIKKRLFKTYFPAVLVSLLWGGYMKSRGNVEINWDFINGIIWNFNDGVLWFVRAILDLYIAFMVYAVIRLRLRADFIKKCVLWAIALTSIFTLFILGVIPYPVHASSALLFFVGIYLAEFPTVINKKCIGSIFFAIIVIATIYRHNANVIHCAIDYFLILLGIGLLAAYNISLPKLPKWAGSTSYDIYLVHYKAKIILTSIMDFVPLWAFAGLTIVLSIIFHNFRKLIERILN